MPHAALIAAAITAGVGTAVAFEVGVFRPWREVNWPNGIAQGLKQEWQEFSEDMKDGFKEISGDLRRQRQNRRDQEQRSSRSRGDSDLEEEMQLRREMDEFSLHEAQSTGLKSRYASEFGDDGVTQRRNLQGAAAEEEQKEDVHLARTSYIDHLDSSSDVQIEGLHASIYHDVSYRSSPIVSNQHPDETSRRTSRSPTIPRQSEPSQRKEDNDTALQSPPFMSRQASIQDDWQSQISASTNGTISDHTDHNDEDSGSASWVQLTDSRPNSPWSDTDMVERR